MVFVRILAWDWVHTLVLGISHFAQLERAHELTDIYNDILLRLCPERQWIDAVNITMSFHPDKIDDKSADVLNWKLHFAPE
jgi:hypothetical protein